MSREEIKLLERDIQVTCLEWLNYQPGVKVWRQNTGAHIAVHNGQKRFIRFGQVGAADITGIGPNGRRIEIEVKRPPKKPTEEQLAWLAMIRQHGGIAFWCDSFEMCEQKWRDNSGVVA